jgi:hypothetical protein
MRYIKPFLFAILVIVILTVIASNSARTNRDAQPTQVSIEVTTVAIEVQPTVEATIEIISTATAEVVRVATDEEALMMLPAILNIGRIERDGEDFWAVVQTRPNFNDIDFARLVFAQAGTVNPLITRFSVQIDDEVSNPLWHTYDASTGEWTSGERPSWVIP